MKSYENVLNSNSNNTVKKVKEKTSTLKRTFAQCLTEDDAINQQKIKEERKSMSIKKKEESQKKREDAKLKKEESKLKKENSKKTIKDQNTKKIQKDKEKKKKDNTDDVKIKNDEDKENTLKKCYLYNTKFNFSSNNSNNWISCEDCPNWMCPNCIKKSKAIPSNEFYCPECLNKKNKI